MSFLSPRLPGGVPTPFFSVYMVRPFLVEWSPEPTGESAERMRRQSLLRIPSFRYTRRIVQNAVSQQALPTGIPKSRHLYKLRKVVSMSSNPGIMVEVAPGELIDKITILEIKAAQITDAAKLENVRIELETLSAVRDNEIPPSDELTATTSALKVVNEQLWEIEDNIRECERKGDFRETFIELARSVYRSNDRRAALKREVNQLLGSRLMEEKSYAEY